MRSRYHPEKAKIRAVGKREQKECSGLQTSTWTPQTFGAGTNCRKIKLCFIFASLLLAWRQDAPLKCNRVTTGSLAPQSVPLSRKQHRKIHMASVVIANSSWSTMCPTEFPQTVDSQQLPSSARLFPKLPEHSAPQQGLQRRCSFHTHTFEGLSATYRRVLPGCFRKCKPRGLYTTSHNSSKKVIITSTGGGRLDAWECAYPLLFHLFEAHLPMFHLHSNSISRPVCPWTVCWKYTVSIECLVHLICDLLHTQAAQSWIQSA